MSAFQCPSCGGSFPRPAERPDDKPQCPWCGEVGQLEMSDRLERVRSVVTDDSDAESAGLWGDGLLKKLRGY